MKKKLALTFSSIQQLSKNEQKNVNGGWGGGCGSGFSACTAPIQMLPPGAFSINHPCNSSSPYFSGLQNCLNYCNAGGCCCS